MFKTEWFQIKSKIFIMYGPLFRKIKKFPFSAAFFTSMIVPVHFFPAGMFFLCIPDHLWVGTNQKIFSPSFQFFTFRSVNYFIIFPTVCNPHIFISCCNCLQCCNYILSHKFRIYLDVKDKRCLTNLGQVIKASMLQYSITQPTG